MISSHGKIAVPALLFLLVTNGAMSAQSAKILKPGVKGVQVPFALLKPRATLKDGGLDARDERCCLGCRHKALLRAAY
jgi:hypothetical protein